MRSGLKTIRQSCVSRPAAGRSAPLADNLTVWETADTVYVGWTGAGDDWLACFAKTEDFPTHRPVETAMGDLRSSASAHCPSRWISHTQYRASRDPFRIDYARSRL